MAWCLAPKGWPLRWAGLLAWLPLCLNSNVYPQADQFKVTALDVGQGMAVLIETQQHRMLYDAGPAYSAESDAGMGVIYPYLKTRGITQLDALMISHGDKDHVGGALSLLQRLKVGWTISSLSSDDKFIHTAQQLVPHITCLADQKWQWDGVQFEVLHPSSAILNNPKSKSNAKSCTLKISNKNHSILLAGDIESVQESALINTMPEKLSATLLLAPHHGSGTSSSEPFLEAVHPKIAIFQVGYHNRYHHPKPVVWQRYADLGIKRLRSDQAGAIMVSFANEITVEEYRQTHARYWYPIGETN